MKKIATGLLAGTAALGGLYVLSTQGRTGHPGLGVLKTFKYAHWGLHDTEKPENSMAAFRAALESGYGIEFDIHLIRDGNLAVIHDAALLRTTGQEGIITDLTTEDLRRYHLNGTAETIPTFRQVLELFSGKAPLIIELKSDGNPEALVDAAVKAVEDYAGPYCMESFDPRCVYILKKKYPHIIRGQLTEDYFRSGSKLPAPLKWALKNQVLNFLTMPDFVAYKYRDIRTFSNRLVRDFWGVAGVTWTLRSQEELDDAIAENWIPIFENFKP